jgi:regulator of nucleoside diphosphate kinase
MSERRIYMTDMDYKRLSGILRALKTSVTGKGPQIDAFAADVNNAVVVSPEDIPSNVVTMNSTVRFIDLSSGEEKTCTIVFPADADIEKGRVSVFAPIGSALMGETVGNVVSCLTPRGEVNLKICEVVYQPEASGVYR